MTHVALTGEQLDHAAEIAAAIGRAIRLARRARGESVGDVAREHGTHPSSLLSLERGDQPNVKLGNAVRYLDRYGLTLAIVPKPPAEPRVAPHRWRMVPQAFPSNSQRAGDGAGVR
jgi:hypothetical protein